MALIRKTFICFVVVFLCVSCTLTDLKSLLKSDESPFDIYSNENGDYELRSIALIRKQQFIVAGNSSRTRPSLLVGDSETKSSTEIYIGLFRPILILSDPEHVYFIGRPSKHEKINRLYTPVARIPNELPFSDEEIEYLLLDWSARVDFGDVSCQREEVNINTSNSTCILALASFDSRFLTTVNFVDSDFQSLDIVNPIAWQENLQNLYTSGAVLNVTEVQLDGLSPNSLAVSIDEKEVYVSFSDEMFIANINLKEQLEGQSSSYGKAKINYHRIPTIGSLGRLQLIEKAGNRKILLASDVDNSKIVTIDIGNDCGKKFCLISRSSFTSPEQNNNFLTRGLVLPVANSRKNSILALESDRKTIHTFRVGLNGDVSPRSIIPVKLENDAISIISDPYSECFGIIKSLVSSGEDSEDFARARMSVEC